MKVFAVLALAPVFAWAASEGPVNDNSPTEEELSLLKFPVRNPDGWEEKLVDKKPTGFYEYYALKRYGTAVVRGGTHTRADTLLPEGWERTVKDGKPFYQYYVNQSGEPWPLNPDKKKDIEKVSCGEGTHCRARPLVGGLMVDEKIIYIDNSLNWSRKYTVKHNDMGTVLGPSYWLTGPNGNKRYSTIERAYKDLESHRRRARRKSEKAKDSDDSPDDPSETYDYELELDTCRVYATFKTHNKPISCRPIKEEEVDSDTNKVAHTYNQEIRKATKEEKQEQPEQPPLFPVGSKAIARGVGACEILEAYGNVRFAKLDNEVLGYKACEVYVDQLSPCRRRLIESPNSDTATHRRVLKQVRGY